jgi:type III pantothenate kinase
MLLAADIGNTNITLGLFRGRKCVCFGRLASDTRRTADEYAILVRHWLELHGVEPGAVTDAVTGSVVPVLTAEFDSAIHLALGLRPFSVNHTARMPVVNRYGKPREVGIDRLANAAGGVVRYGAPLLVVDLGTAVTIDVISRDREYLGGAILPGIEMSAEALSRRTARLPLAAARCPEHAVGRTTVESIRSGILHGLVGAVDRLIELTWKELGYKTKVVATGGMAEVLITHSRHVRRQDQEITLNGLMEIWQMNCGDTQKQPPARAARKRSAKTRTA